jgi:ABC-type polysaccharide/polyol phosphate export permease
VLVPLVMIPQLLFVAGLALFVAALNTFYEDVKYMLGVGLYLLFYLCPIFYFSENVAKLHLVEPKDRHTVYVIYHLNPMAMYATTYRKLLLPQQPVEIRAGKNKESYPALPIDRGLLGVTVGVSILTFWAGYTYFNRRKWEFVERP